MIRKDYDSLCKKVNELMEKFHATRDDYGAYYIETPCGKLRVAISDFARGKKYSYWIYTRIEKPDMVIENIRKLQNFNKFSGKFNEYSDNIQYLVSWLSCYINDLLYPFPSGFRRVPDGIYMGEH